MGDRGQKLLGLSIRTRIRRSAELQNNGDPEFPSHSELRLASAGY